MSKENLIAPDVTELILPVAGAIQSAAQAVVKPTKELPMKRSFFKSDKSKYAGKVELDGETFYFDRISDGALEQIEAVPQRVARALGLTLEQIAGTPRELNTQEKQAAALLGITEEKVAELRAVFTPEQEKAKGAIELESVDVVLVDALRAWSLDAPCDDENKRDLHLDIKVRLCDRISSFTRAGETEARFHQRNSGSDS